MTHRLILAALAAFAIATMGAAWASKIDTTEVRYADALAH